MADIDDGVQHQPTEASNDAIAVWSAMLQTGAENRS
jgi:hypothetical protein